MSGREPDDRTQFVLTPAPVEALLETVMRKALNLLPVVLGTAVHGSLFGSNQVLGSEIERVIRNAPCPVLCVPAAKAVTPLPAFVTQAVPQT